MVTLFIRHQVKEFGMWKLAYDSFGTTRQKMGVSAAAIFQDRNEPSMLIVTHQFDNMDCALAFANSTELKSTMQNAGVANLPELWFGEEVERTAH